MYIYLHICIIETIIIDNDVFVNVRIESDSKIVMDIDAIANIISAELRVRTQVC